MTAVDYLTKSLDLINWIEDDGQPHTQLKMLDEAQKLEKQQIIDAFEMGRFNIDDMGNGEEYYNETYGSKGSETKK